MIHLGTADLPIANRRPAAESTIIDPQSRNPPLDHQFEIAKFQISETGY
jgi:hypothetical protein